MNVKLIFLFFCLLQSALAQRDTVIAYDFDNNDAGWHEGSNSEYSAKVQNGKYIFAHFTSSSYRHFSHYHLIKPESNFRIETMIRQLNGVENHGYGLIWGRDGYRDAFRFIISSNGMYSISKHEANEWVSIVQWTNAREIINPMGEYNSLTIQKTGEKIKFIINGTQVEYLDFQRFYGTFIGFETNLKMTCEVEYLSIIHPHYPVNLTKSYKEVVEKKNLGSSINSSHIEKAPVISPDGNTLFFDRQHPDNVGNSEKSDIWFSEKHADGTWSIAKNIGRPLNNAGHNFVISVSPDGNTLLLGNTYNKDGSADTRGLSSSYRTRDGWSIPEDVVIKDFMNKYIYVNYFLSADRKILLSSVEREDTYGLMDIYVSFLEEDGSWSVPLNLGPKVNTFSMDFAPFLAGDNRTMYFASKGHPGYGSSDLFVTRRLGEGWTDWTEPENMGTYVNSSSWDAYLTLPASGNIAYTVSTENSLGQDDIFSINLPESAKPEPVVLISGRVLSSKDSSALQAEIKYFDLESNRELGIAISNPNDGSYKIVLPKGRQYSFLAQKENYFPISDNIDIKKLELYNEIKRDLYLAPIEKGMNIRLNNLFFNYDKYEIKKESFPELERLIQLMNAYKSMKIEIAGHTDSMGSDSYNKTLSQKRVNSVLEYLEEKGINTSRLVGKGYGESAPIDNNDTEEGRARNRRVEFKIIEE